ERTHSSGQGLHDDLSGAARGHRVDRGRCFYRFSVAVQYDRGADHRYSQGHARRAVFHARTLQRAFDLGNPCVGAILDGDLVRFYAQRLLYPQLALNRLLNVTPYDVTTRPAALRS